MLGHQVFNLLVFVPFEKCHIIYLVCHHGLEALIIGSKLLQDHDDGG